MSSLSPQASESRPTCDIVYLVFCASMCVWLLQVSRDAVSVPWDSGRTKGDVSRCNDKNWRSQHGRNYRLEVCMGLGFPRDSHGNGNAKHITHISVHGSRSGNSNSNFPWEWKCGKCGLRILKTISRTPLLQTIDAVNSHIRLVQFSVLYFSLG